MTKSGGKRCREKINERGQKREKRHEWAKNRERKKVK